MKHHPYLLIWVLWLVVWLLLFLRNRTMRNQMMWMSVIFMFAWPAADIIYVLDRWTPSSLFWWFPLFEGALAWFWIWGVASVIYEVVFKDELVYVGDNKWRSFRRDLSLLLLCLLCGAVFLSSYFWFWVDSFVATLLCLSLPTLLMLIKRKDLFRNSLYSWLLLLLIYIIIYLLIWFVSPWWIWQIYFFNNTTHTIILWMPIDDVFWYFFAGMFIWPLYEFRQHIKIAHRV